jgi:DNA topoisomerase VI subunit B
VAHRDGDGPRHRADAEAREGSALGTCIPSRPTSDSKQSLARTTFKTSRLLDFCSEKELIAQTGHRPAQWLIVILKELADNALDACEEANTAPKITITVDAAGITVADNGPGLPEETVNGVLDFAVRVSSREAYVSPTRGAQGNALKTIVAMPFVRDGRRGQVEIEARGTRHIITLAVDQVRQEPVIRHERAESKIRVGTVVRVPWPGLAQAELDDEAEEEVDDATDDEAEEEEVDDAAEVADSPIADSPRSIPNAKSRFLQIATDYAWLNPNATITVSWFGEETSMAATDLAWSKWRPSEPTSPHWYTPAHLERLIGAYIKHDADHGRERTVRELVAEFRGLSGTAKQKTVLDATGLARAPLSALIKGTEFDRAKVEKLLAAMKASSVPVKPVMLGTIGKEHFKQRLAAAGCELASFEYRGVPGVEDDIPWMIETAFAWCPGAKQRRLITGVNWSPGILNPFRELGDYGTSLDTMLARARADTCEPVILAIHIACPRVEYTDRGKSALVLAAMKSEALLAAITGVTRKWTKQRKQEERERSAILNRHRAMTRYRTVSIRQAAWQVMEAAFMQASANNTLPANARQIMYAARPKIAELADRDIGTGFDKYFTQTLLPAYIRQRRPPWASKVVFDARGHFAEPHTYTAIGLGTLEVRNYVAGVRSHRVNGFAPDVREAGYPTHGPKNRFGAILFLEKEGFGPLLRAVNLAARYDLAIMSTKGMSVTASRELVEELCATHDIPLLVLHDFDISGFTIFGTLRSSTDRFRYRRRFNVIDIGLRLADIEGLEREEVYVSSPSAIAATLRRHGATEAEIDVLAYGERVELNALASNDLVTLIERKLAEHGIRKVIPDDDTLADAYRRMHKQAVIQDKVDDLIQELDESEVKVPANLRRRIERAIKADPSQSWDSIMRELSAPDGDKP